MLSQELYSNHTPIKNKGFSILDEVFSENGWHKVKNEYDYITFAKFGHESEQFEIYLNKTTVRVVVLLKNSQYRYATTFDNYFQASDYVEERFYEYIEN
jgi:hypothetical protein